jgi:hypothetical protein
MCAVQQDNILVMYDSRKPHMWCLHDIIRISFRVQKDLQQHKHLRIGTDMFTSQGPKVDLNTDKETIHLKHKNSKATTRVNSIPKYLYTQSNLRW